MKRFLISSLSALAIHVHLCSGTRNPLLQWDPDTAKDCDGWYNNVGSKSCEDIRDLFNITAEQFSEWNPSVGLDCKPWRWQSYCIVTLERLEGFNQTQSTTAISPTTTTATTTRTRPSPTSWLDKGCYAESSTKPILEKQMSGPGGNSALTIPKCQHTCYLENRRFAGLQEGNQCWCSNYIFGDWTQNQTACNLPCSGDKESVCGGKGLITIFEAEIILKSFTWSSTESSSPTAGAVSGAETIVNEVQDSGAVKNIGFF
ncbi:WSC domain-containing protein [Paramyrothecium foliicola]|nr:WSC domain-containing protein [Paramyrothecium foliicola]